MKIRMGFVSNSSSSSFIIASNKDLHDTLTENWDEFFPVGTDNERTKDLIDGIKSYAIYDIINNRDYTWTCWQSYVDYYNNECWGSINEDEDTPKIKELFDRWKKVHSFSIPSNGDGGTALTNALRGCFPREFKNDKCELFCDCEG